MARPGLFEVDIEGMRAEALRRGWGPLLTELAANAMDEHIIRADMRIDPTNVRGQYMVSIEDDSPTGFRQLSDAFTMFAPSYKRSNPEQSGRFNIGEKYVVAACEWAEIITTTGGFHFDRKTRERTQLRRRREVGTVFRGVIRANQDEVAEALEWLRLIIPRDGKIFTVNGTEVLPREPLTTIEETLATVIDRDGVLRPTRRITKVSIYRLADGEVPMLYELGMPVCEIDTDFAVNAWQRVPLSQDRDTITEAYRRSIHVVALNAAAQVGALNADIASSLWVKDAASDDRASDEAVKQRLDLMFGKNRVAFDPSDTEASKRAMAKNYRVVYPRELTPEERAQVRRVDGLTPAGRIPEFKTDAWDYSADPDATEERVIPEDQWTDGMRNIASYARWLAKELLGASDIQITMVNEPIRRAGKAAAYSPGRLLFNVGTLRHRWFEHSRTDVEVNCLLLHEFAHHTVSDHLEERFAETIAGLGAKLVALALASPESFTYAAALAAV